MRRGPYGPTQNGLEVQRGGKAKSELGSRKCRLVTVTSALGRGSAQTPSGVASGHAERRAMKGGRGVSLGRWPGASESRWCRRCRR
jgi:hypothetical protein